MDIHAQPMSCTVHVIFRIGLFLDQCSYPALEDTQINQSLGNAFDGSSAINVSVMFDRVRQEREDVWQFITDGGAYAPAFSKLLAAE